METPIKFDNKEYQKKYQKEYYYKQMNDEEWRKHRAEIVKINMRKMRAKKKEELIASGNPPKLGRKVGGKNKPKENNNNLPREPSEPPELFNIIL
jgi:hypothetical protein